MAKTLQGQTKKRARDSQRMASYNGGVQQKRHHYDEAIQVAAHHCGMDYFPLPAPDCELVLVAHAPNHRLRDKCVPVTNPVLDNYRRERTHWSWELTLPALGTKV